MKDRTHGPSPERHPHDHVSKVVPPLGAMHEELRRSVAADLGPRRPGAISTTPAGEMFEVIDVVTDAAEARRITGRRSAQFAVFSIRFDTVGTTASEVDVWMLNVTTAPWDRANELLVLGNPRQDPR